MDIWKIDQVDALREEFLSRLLAASTAQQLEEVRVAYMGSNGRVQLLTRQIGQVPPEQRADFGKAVQLPDIQKVYSNVGAVPVTSTPEEFAAHIGSEMGKLGRLVQLSGARID